MINRMIVLYLVLAAPVAAAVLFWGSWGWLAVAAVVGVIQYGVLEDLARQAGRLARLRRPQHQDRVLPSVIDSFAFDST